MFSKVLIANRGVAAVRIARTLKRLGIASVALRTSPERGNDYFAMFDEVFDLSGDSVADTYLNIDQILAIAMRAGVGAVHPGYGFLSENEEFAIRVADAGLAFLGPSPEVIKIFGLKHEARAIAERQNVPILRGTDILSDLAAALAAAEQVGFPLLLKSTAGGGGIGMQRCDNVDQLGAAFDSVTALAQSNFTSPGVFIEKCITQARHVEVQLFGDGQGNVVILGDRDCSLQRRNQKLVEECPAPNLPAAIRISMHKKARALAASVNYASAGTIEFLYDAEAERYYFLEVNTRLQVEHGVSELVYGVDIIEWMIRLAAGELPNCAELESAIEAQGAAVQVRLYAEDPFDNFKPTPGTLDVVFPQKGRIDSWVGVGSLVSHWFDPLLANVMSHAQTRTHAIAQLLETLEQTRIYGTTTNLALLRQALNNDRFRAGEVDTGLLKAVTYQPNELEILRPGLEMTVQSYPGRQGYWDVGVPPSGPMDDLSFQTGNRMLGNPATAAGLEMVLGGVKIRFRNSTRCVLIGAQVEASLDGHALNTGAVFEADVGQILSIDDVKDGLRSYLLLRGGLDVADFLGSSATFVLGKFGGHQGRALRAGDVLRWIDAHCANLEEPLEQCQRADLSTRKKLRVLLGPHAAPDFFTSAWIRELFEASWQVDHNSNRTGIRLIGPTPQWAREDGGEAGLHPSNIHDSAYAFGAMDFTGDMPVILGPDGPSLGGFVCPVVVINADRWKLGQLAPGDFLQLQLVDRQQAQQISAEHAGWLEGEISRPIEPPYVNLAEPSAATQILLYEDSEVLIRQAGQEWLLIEFGAAVLDLRVRIVVGEFAQFLRHSDLPGIVEQTAGVRSLLVRFDLRIWTHDELVAALQPMLQEALSQETLEVDSRIVQLPLSWNDPACQEAVDRYMKNVRPDAPWGPDNIEFIRRINGLNSVDQVKQIVFQASYFVFGLGDVYLGAPLATPLDPAHRLVTTKYNPARTWTAEGSVGIGGSYMCIYGMEGPGGYQFVGRTIPVWRGRGFGPLGRQNWLLRNYDQICYTEVDAKELVEIREACAHNEYLPTVEAGRLDLRKYHQRLETDAARIGRFQTTRQTAFAEELGRWKQSESLTFKRAVAPAAPFKNDDLDGEIISCPISASVWKLLVRDAEAVEEGQEIAVLESMKTEVPLVATASGLITLLVVEGQTVAAGESVAVVAAARSLQ